MNFLINYFKIFIIIKIFNKINEDFMTCNKDVPSSTKSVYLDFYLNIRWQNGVSIESLIPKFKGGVAYSRPNKRFWYFNP
jgi:hypothetical protein